MRISDWSSDVCSSDLVARKTDYDLAAKSDTQMEGVLARLEGRTIVSSDRQNIFTITYQDTDPERAYGVVQALLTIFVEGNLGRSRQDFDTAEHFIDRQLEEYETRPRAVENRLEDGTTQHRESGWKY